MDKINVPLLLKLGIAWLAGLSRKDVEGVFSNVRDRADILADLNIPGAEKARAVVDALKDTLDSKWAGPVLRILTEIWYILKNRG